MKEPVKMLTLLAVMALFVGFAASIQLAGSVTAAEYCSPTPGCEDLNPACALKKCCIYDPYDRCSPEHPWFSCEFGFEKPGCTVKCTLWSGCATSCEPT